MTAESQKFQVLRPDPKFPTYSTPSPWWGFPLSPAGLSIISQGYGWAEDREKSLPTPPSPCSPPASHTSFSSFLAHLLPGSALLCPPYPSRTSPRCSISPKAAGGRWGHTQKKAVGWLWSWRLPTCIALATEWASCCFKQRSESPAPVPAARRGTVPMYYCTVRAGLEPSSLNHSVGPSCSMAWSKPRKSFLLCLLSSVLCFSAYIKLGWGKRKINAVSALDFSHLSVFAERREKADA